MKLTAHHLGASESAQRLVRETGARWVKLVGSFGEAADYKRQFPGLQIIGRLYQHPDWSAATFDPIAAARDDFAGVLAAARANPAVDYWESGNEIIPTDYDAMARIAAYDCEFMRLCEAAAMKACVGNFATGTPGARVDPIPDSETIHIYWGQYRPALERAAAGGHLVGFHEYIGGPADETWLQFRYRRMLWYCRSTGRPTPRVAITECGVDAINGSKPWREMYGDDLAGQQRYVETLVRYEMGLRQDPEVVAACVFTSGTGGSDKWRPHDIDGTEIPQMLGAWARANPEQPPAPPPAAHVLGVDVSKWQGQMDWQRTRSAGAEFTFIKATEGASVRDPFLVANVDGARAVGLLIGLYHFYRPGLDAATQAECFLRAYPAGGAHLPPALDLEVAPDAAGRDAYRRGVQTWLDLVELRLGVRPVLYTNQSFYDTHLAGLGLQGKYPLWIANYTAGPAPALPAEYKSFAFWQYTNQGNGSQYGAKSASIDLNRYAGTAAQLRAAYPLHGASAPPQPPQPPPAGLVGRRVRVKVSGLNLRPGPSTDRPPLTVLVSGTELPVSAQDGQWVRVTRDGWLLADRQFIDVV